VVKTRGRPFETGASSMVKMAGMLVVRQEYGVDVADVVSADDVSQSLVSTRPPSGHAPGGSKVGW
jgi:hypothetical protein